MRRTRVSRQHGHTTAHVPCVTLALSFNRLVSSDAYTFILFILLVMLYDDSNSSFFVWFVCMCVLISIVDEGSTWNACMRPNTGCSTSCRACLRRDRARARTSCARACQPLCSCAIVSSTRSPASRRRRSARSVWSRSTARSAPTWPIRPASWVLYSASLYS